MKKFSIVLSMLMITYHSYSQELARRANLGFRSSSPSIESPGAIVREVVGTSAFAKAGLKIGDRIVKYNGELLNDADRWSDMRYQARKGDQVELLIKRKDRILTLSAKLEETPRENYQHVDVLYGSVLSDYGQRLRTIVTKPKGQKGKLPALFVLQGLSCSSIEVFPGRFETGWTQFLRDIASKTNMIVMRVEKPGVGDSEGACSQTDLRMEMAGYRAALQKLKSREDVDTTKLIVYGSSMGSALAPILANEFNAVGIISDGTFVKTWFEHMLEIERRILAFKGNSPTEVNTKINEAYIPLYYGMLVEKKSYEQVINEKPHLKEFNYHGAKHMYGRPVEYYHQVQDLNIAGAWAEVKVPVRIMRGTNDWIMSDEDNDMIIEILEDAGHTDHQLYRYEGLDHWNRIHDSAISSFQGNPGKWEDEISGIVIDWSQEMVGIR
ncbi:PDZ domain-containing protein [Fulvivirgaceae bacterium BMA10]|uniref:PDZ domain-containing protein n=1 Tax=Splendidivirga corallicola TaxID=3051826 RepID=A0ABT8KZH1_9BACT|nr:PDZ domain-containing protein [Fulvivirgaceae bacterium BMA10]